MKEVELFVGLKIPDTTAITAFHTLERMGFSQLKKLERKQYYKFFIDGGEEDFKKRISKVDILVNANKNNFGFVLNDKEKKKRGNFRINILIRDIGDGSALLGILKERLGLTNIKKMDKGVLWIMDIKAEDKKEAEKMAVKAAKTLLLNENYQDYALL
jgi:phosphoribosylformylglycinamidine (FGAM) synthase PurS component